MKAAQVFAIFAIGIFSILGTWQSAAVVRAASGPHCAGPLGLPVIEIEDAAGSAAAPTEWIAMDTKGQAIARCMVSGLVAPTTTAPWTAKPYGNVINAGDGNLLPYPAYTYKPAWNFITATAMGEYWVYAYSVVPIVFLLTIAAASINRWTSSSE